MQPNRNALIFGGIYLLALAGTLYAEVSGQHRLEYFTKPLLMLSLSIWFFLGSRRVGDRFTLLVQAGLFFSLVGDVCLMFAHVDEFNFLVGLGAFFLAQLCYAMAFIDNIIQVGGLEGLLLSFVLSVLIAAYAWFFTWDLMPSIDDMLLLPVVAYSVALALMGIAAAFRHTRTFRSSFLMVFFGSLLFIASDSLLAVNRFRKPFVWAPIGIMVTYALAQWLIAAGALRHVLDPDTIRRRTAQRT